MERAGTNGVCASGLPWFLTGLVAGIAVTLLVAPASGAASRRFLGSRLREGENWVKTKATEAEEYAVSQTTALRDRVKEAAQVMVKS